MKKALKIASFLVGINATLSQTVLIRELLVNFSGNELSMGIILGVWLIGGGIGSIIFARRSIDTIKRPVVAFAILFSIISILAPCLLFIARIARFVFNIPTYELISPFQAMGICAILLLPISSLLSICFILSCKMLKHVLHQENAVGVAYVIEACGATAAGIIFTFLLVRYFNSFQILLVFAAINFLYLLWLASLLKRRFYFSGVAFVVLVLAGLSGGADFLHNKSKDLQWHPQKVASYKNSPYGNITVISVGRGFNFYENGSLLFTTQDKAFNEEFANLIMLQHAQPEEVLIIGNAIGGLLKEILQHNPKTVTYLELDYLTIKIGKDFISPDDRNSLSDHRSHIIYADGRFFINTTDKKFDVIIINLPDPTTLQLNRFYTEDFFKKVSSCLKKEGILALRIISKESIISDELARYNSSVYKTLKTVFAFVTYIPGENLIFIASNSAHILDGRPDILIKRFDERKIKTDFLTRYHIKDLYYPNTVLYLAKRLVYFYDKVKINRDLHPITFYYGFVLFGILSHPGLLAFFNLILNLKLIWIVALTVVFVVVGFFIIIKKRDYINYITPAAIALTGALAMTIEIILILFFQITYGNVYERVGFLISLFMLGLACGGYITNKYIVILKDHIKLLSQIVLIYSIYILLAPIIIKTATAFSSVAFLQFIFYIMILLAGIIAGCQFPVAVAILQKEKSSSYAASLIWGADLFGAAFGVFISSLIIIPLLGMFQTTFVGFLLGIGMFILLLLSRQRQKR